MKMYKKNFLRWFIFFLLVGVMALFKFHYHELWKDEWQAWLIAKDSSSWGHLFSLLPAEGHPPLWFILLRCVSYIQYLTPYLEAEYLLQGVHLILYMLTLYVFIFRFTYSIWLKLALLAGYFLFFEYGVINRSYILLIFLTFLLSWMSENPTKNWLKLSIIIILLCLTEVYGIFISLSFIAFIYFRIRKTKGDSLNQYWVLPLLAWISGLMVFLLSIGFFSGYAGSPDMFTSFEGKNVIEKILLGVQSLFANTLWIGSSPISSQEVSKTAMLFSLCIILLTHLFLRKQKWMYLSYFLFISVLFAFTLIYYQGGPRHWGVHLIFLIALLNHYPSERLSPGIAMFAFYGLLASISFFQFIHNGKILVKEKEYAFSNAKYAGKYIKNNIRTEDIIIGINKAYCTPVIGYCGRTFIELPSTKPFSFFTFNEKTYLPSPNDLNVFKRKNSAKNVYVISYIPLPINQFTNVTYVREFSGRNIRNENYFIYLVN